LDLTILLSVPDRLVYECAVLEYRFCRVCIEGVVELTQHALTLTCLHDIGKQLLHFAFCHLCPVPPLDTRHHRRNEAVYKNSINDTQDEPKRRRLAKRPRRKGEKEDPRQISAESTT
jgi:hypothetical protein